VVFTKTQFVKFISLLFWVFLIAISCNKTEEIISPVIPVVKEDPIQFTTNLDTGTFIIKDTINLLLTVTSKIPAQGIQYTIKGLSVDSTKELYKMDTTLTSASLAIKIPSFRRPGNYEIQIELSSKTIPTNAAKKTLKAIRKVEDYLKSSYELSTRAVWLEIPGGYATFIQFDYNLDGEDDVLMFEGYDINVPYTWPGPQFYTGNPIKNVSSGISVDNKKIFARKMLIGDYDKNGYPDVFLITGMDPAGCVNCSEPLLPTYIMYNRDGKTFNVKAFSDWKSAWSAASSGDIDNDGDLDIIQFNTKQNLGVSNKFLMNDGKGNFSARASGIDNIGWVDRSELIDIDKDGFLDLVLNDVVDENGYANRFRIMWGNGKDFTAANSTRITIPNDMFLLDIDAYDIDNDGFKELVLPMNYANGSWKVFIYETTNNKIFNKQAESALFTSPVIWNEPISIVDADSNGIKDIVLNDKRHKIRWEYISGQLVRK
jgi:hypothetical protein